MKGIVLAGGLGTRLYPAAKAVSKQLMPVYDKPMIYYPLSVLMLAGIKDMLIITTPYDADSFKKLLGDGSLWGVSFSYVVQNKPKGLAHAFIVGKDFVNNEPVTLILGDNIFWGHGFVEKLRDAVTEKDGATVFGYWVNDPQRYGVVDFDKSGKVVSIEEKPKNPRSNYAVTGLYCYDDNTFEYASQVKPSDRGELEITDLNRIYLEKEKLRVRILGRGVAWLDTGTHSSMLVASHFIETVQDRQGLIISSPEEIAFRMGFIDKEQLIKLAEPMKINNYGKYLDRLANGKV